MEKRLQKLISERGYTSRRKAEELILAGKVLVNGKVVRELGAKFDEKVKIEICGELLELQEKEYYVINKPRGVVTTTKDDKNRKTIMDFFDINTRLYPIGRLDYDTTGVLLVTNDGDFSQLLMHPKNNIDKVYIAKLEGIIDAYSIKKLKDGILIDGRKTSKARVKLKKIDKKNNTCIVQIVIHEGMYHQVKRMFESVGHNVLKLKREAYAFITVDGLKPGEYRRLNKKEVHQLYALANNNKLKTDKGYFE